MRLILLRLTAFLAGVFLAGAAHAGCTASSTTVNFANSSSYAVQDGSVAPVTGQAGLSCTGSLLSVLGGSHARATISSARGFKLQSAAGAQIPYQASADSGGTVVMTQGGTVDYVNPTLLALLGIGSLNGFNAPIYVKLTGAPNIAAGTYTDVLTVTWDYSICNGVQVAGICVLYETGQVTKTITINLVVENDCRISAPNVSFGSAPLVSQFSQVSQGVLVNCTKDSAYKVAFSKGLGAASRPWRTMSDGAGHALQYNIYRADGTTIWDETNPLTSALQGTGSTTPSQIQNYIVKIDPAQTTPPAGSYSDTVSVVITF